MDIFSTCVEAVTTLLTLCGLGYLLLALWSAQDFSRRGWGAATEFAPDVTVLKPVRGVDPRMYAAFASHCRQEYAGRVELLFGVSSAEDAAVAEIERLRVEFPVCDVRLVVCPKRLGTSGKVSNLVQMLRAAKYEHVVINDSDILVEPRYLQRVMAPLSDAKVGLITAPYRGMTVAQGATVWAKLEALGITTDFLPSVLVARKIEGGIRFGLGSTLATTKSAIAQAGGLEPLVEYLADDYELGARIAKAGLHVEMVDEVVETAVPQYGLRGFLEHQLRWVRAVRDSRRWGYLGVVTTYALAWAMLNCMASGLALWSFSLLSIGVLARVALALSVGVGVLRDGQVLRDLWLLPVRDLCGLGLWAWSYAGDTVVWRGERFRLKDGRLIKR